MRVALTGTPALVTALVLTVPAAAGPVAHDGSRPAPANGTSESGAVSGDGRFVAFDSSASNLVAGDTNRHQDVFVRDRTARTTERVSISSAEVQASNHSWSPAISADGRFVAFTSKASNLVPRDTNRHLDVFVRDRRAGTTERVSVSAGGAQGDNFSSGAVISADGRFVAFESGASNLITGDTNRVPDIYVRDRIARTTERASVSSTGAQANDGSSSPALSADGRFVAFASNASTLAGGDTNAKVDVFVRDLLVNTTARVSVSSGGVQASGESWSPAINFDGSVVAFVSAAPNLVPADTNGKTDVFVRDSPTATTERVNVSTAGAQANEDSDSPYAAVAISADGRVVAFHSYASNLVADDTNGANDVFVRDRPMGRTERVSLSSVGAEHKYGGEAGESARSRWISSNGRFVAFIAGGDLTNVFLRDRQTGRTELVSAGRAWAPRGGRLQRQPWPPRAGRILRATLFVRAGGGPVAHARAGCRARVAGRLLQARARSFRASRVRCLWRIPTSAGGKLFDGLLSARNAYGTAARRFAGRVRR